MLERLHPGSIALSAPPAGPSLACARLAALPFLSPEERTALEQCMATRSAVRAGAELVRQGGSADNLYILTECWACQYIETRDGRRQISALLLPGDICNLDSLLFRQLDCGVRTLTAGALLAVSRERVATLAAAFPGIARAFAWLASVENAILSRRTFCIGRLSARERLAHLLCELAVRLGFHAEEGRISFDMPLTQEHLADVLGLTPVHVNRTMQQLRSECLLEVTRRTIAIPDIAGLRRVGEFEPGYLRAEAPEDGPAGVGVGVGGGVRSMPSSFGYAR